MSEPQCKRNKMQNCLEQLKAVTTVVADTGDFEGKTYIFFCLSGCSLNDLGRGCR